MLVKVFSNDVKHTDRLTSDIQRWIDVNEAEGYKVIDKKTHVNHESRSESALSSTLMIIVTVWMEQTI